MENQKIDQHQISPEQWKVEFGKYMQKHRKLKRYTQQELAELLGVTAKSISCNERGHTFPSYENIFRMAALLDMSLDEFAFGYRRFENTFSLGELNDLLESVDMEDRRIIFETVKTMCKLMSKRRQK